MKNMFSRKQLGIPYGLFLVLFVAAPLLVLVYYAFTDGSGKFSITNLLNFFTDPNTLGTLCYSFVLAIVTTLVCLLIAYPVAYILAHSKIKRKAVILLLFVMPMWINFTLRITALKEILSLIEGNLAFYPFLNTVIGMTYDFLPFMIFNEKRTTPKYITYLGKVLPGAIFSMLIVYCLKNVNVTSYSYGLPELIAIIVTVFLHKWEKQMLVSIAGGTICYMLLVQLVFI